MSIKDLTVIVTTSPIPSNPDACMITSVINSVKSNVLHNKNCKIIIACDGTSILNEKYIEFIQNLKRQYENNYITVLLNSKKGHLSGNIRNAFQYIDTEYVLLVQHDLLFVKKIDIESVMNDMKNNPELKHVRFNKRDNIKDGWDNTQLFSSKKIYGKNTYIMTESWSDQNHICKSDYYKDIVLKEVDDGVFMESLLNKISKGYHDKYGTYIYGDVGDKNVIVHLDGSETRRGDTGRECKFYRDKYVKYSCR